MFVYLYTLINSNFEEWYLANKDKDLDSFEMTFDAMAKSGPLYDIEKLNNISSEMIYDTPQEKNIENLLAWANEYNKDDYEILNNDLEFVKKILSTQGPNSREHRKDLKTYSDFMETFGFLYDDYFKNMSFDEINAFKENVPSERINKVLDAYIDYFTNIPEGTTLKDLAKNLGYTDKKKYNKNPELYAGLFTEFYQILNLALSHKINCISVEDVIDVLLYLRQREVVHYNMFKTLYKKYKEMLNIKANSCEDLITSLSGGNQQKVFLARWLNTDAEILLLDNPTQGIDVGAKAEIYKLILELAKQGKTILINTLEIPEIQKVADYCAVFYNGEIIKILEHQEIDEMTVMMYSTNAAQAEEGK